ncbi:unnamed protein product [Caenorhabditis angaria]|uniref:Uncharacterized protein n=1 Tax=Caenorhabditis angaria TaxID=860376 RepID=A0A9P1N893_9PELO|nr:unnamed protein product [Caenorhabditis angaria]
MCSIFYFFDPLITLCGALFPIYCYITLFYAKHPGFLRKINKTSRSRSNTIAISDETNFYFKQLTESWK